MKGLKFTTVDDYFKEIPAIALERMNTVRWELKKSPLRQMKKLDAAKLLTAYNQ